MLLALSEIRAKRPSHSQQIAEDVRNGTVKPCSFRGSVPLYDEEVVLLAAELHATEAEISRHEKGGIKRHVAIYEKQCAEARKRLGL